MTTREQLRVVVQGAWAKFSVPLHVVGWSAVVGIAAPTALALTMHVSVPFLAPPAELRQDSVSVPHATTPEEVRGLYMTSYTAASKKLRTGVFEYAKRNGLNAVVVDIKDFGGDLAFKPNDTGLTGMAPTHPTISDLDAVLSEAQSYGLYRIARLFVFQDPKYARLHPDQAVLNSQGGVWKDNKGISWVDPAAKGNWAYNAAVAREAYGRGFDEVQLDYIRFPTDGKLSSIKYSTWDGKTPKQKVIGDFFRYMHGTLTEKAGIPLSFDLFGYVTWYRDFDLGIGQLLANGLPNAAAISAMVYPSHYGPGTLGFANPADHPYEIVKTSLSKANTFLTDINTACAMGKEKFVVSGSGTPSEVFVPCGVALAHQRPWIQAFDLGAVYTKDMINAQIKAAREQGAGGWLLWNARNVYRDIK